MTQLRREAAEVLKRLSPPTSGSARLSCSALIGMDLEHAIALSTYPRAEETLERLCSVREGGIAVLASATNLKAGLARQLADLVPALEGQSAALREVEMRAFLDDYLALLRWRHLHTQRDGMGRLPAQAVAARPVLCDAMTDAKLGCLLSLPASPVALKHALSAVEAERAVELERESEAPLWWRRAVEFSTALLLLAFFVAEWMIVTMGTCACPPARTDPWTYLHDPWDFACGKKQYFIALAFNLSTLVW